MSEDWKNLRKDSAEIISLYIAGKGRESLEKSKKYFENLEKYFFGKVFDMNSEGRKERERCVKQKIFSDIQYGEIQYCEYNLAVNRSRQPKFGTALGYAHNTAFIDWFMSSLEHLKPSLEDSAEKYLNSSDNFYFDHDGLDKYRGKGRIELFYRNASLAEYYAHYQDKGWSDRYTPLILARMAVEQYVKQMYEDKFRKYEKELGRDFPTVDMCRAELLGQKYIFQAWSNEIFAVIKRGNLNTHSGTSNYLFAVIHSLEVLKECFKYFLQRHN